MLYSLFFLEHLILMDWLQQELAKAFEIKIRGRIGEGVNGDNEMRILNRIVTLGKEGLT